MITKRSSEDQDIYYTIDDTKPTKDLCPANVYTTMGGQVNSYEYQPCGKPLRMHKDGTTHCPEHGEMH